MEPRVYEPSDGTRIVAHVVYGLHTVSILLGLMTGASIAGAFIFSWPSILAVILNYFILIIGFLVLGVWIAYRIGYGWLRLGRHEALPL